jgi:hypothetical protein
MLQLRTQVEQTLRLPVEFNAYRPFACSCSHAAGLGKLMRVQIRPAVMCCRLRCEPWRVKVQLFQVRVGVEVAVASLAPQSSRSPAAQGLVMICCQPAVGADRGRISVPLAPDAPTYP